jgi:hypothetical protein
MVLCLFFFEGEVLCLRQSRTLSLVWVARMPMTRIDSWIWVSVATEHGPCCTCLCLLVTFAIAVPLFPDTFDPLTCESRILALGLSSCRPVRWDIHRWSLLATHARMLRPDIWQASIRVTTRRNYACISRRVMLHLRTCRTSFTFLDMQLQRLTQMDRIVRVNGTQLNGAT